MSVRFDRRIWFFVSIVPSLGFRCFHIVLVVLKWIYTSTPPYAFMVLSTGTALPLLVVLKAILMLVLNHFVVRVQHATKLSSIKTVIIILWNRVMFA
jgi:hypothetical protein